jgi:hypothetical protein
MRFMVLVKANHDTEAEVMPGKELLTALGRFNAERTQAGVLLAGNSLQASTRGARVKFSDTKPTVEKGAVRGCSRSARRVLALAVC